MTLDSGEIGLFIDAAVTHGDATERGDFVRANAAYVRMDELARSIRRSGPGVFMELLEHSVPSVRAAAAFQLLPIEPVRASVVLTEVSKTPRSLVAFAAEMTLKEWKRGRLAVPDWSEP